MYFVHGKLSAGPMADRAAFTKLCRIGQSVRRRGRAHMTASAGGGDRTHWIDQPALIVNILQSSLQRKLFGSVHMTGRAVTAISREAHIAEVVPGAAKAIDRQRSAACGHLLAGMDLVNHLGEVH